MTAVERIGALLAFVVFGGVFSADAVIAERDDDEIEFKGIVQMLPDNPSRLGEWRVGGRTVHVSSATRIRQEDNAVAVGVLVEVEGFLRADGSVEATEVEVEDDEGEFELKGRIESFPSGLIGDWVIGGRTVHVTGVTRIELEDGPVAVGAFAEVEGLLRPDGTVDALKIEIEDDEEEFEFRGMVESLPAGLIGDWVVGGRTVHVNAATRIKQKDGPIAVGAIVQVEGFLRPDGSVDASKIEIKSSAGARVNFKGTIDSLPGSGLIGNWVVDGRMVNVTASTRIKQKHGSIAVGAEVKVKGIQMPGGPVEATMIQLKKSK